ncbi:MAG TPA: DUF1569 domain-containing protein [Thermoanaerobaculia bacterium]
MKSLFHPADRDEILQRIAALRPETTRQWGKMDPAQMLCHCAIALESGSGDRPMKQKLIGKLLMPFIRKSILGPKPFSRNGPTDPTFVVADTRDFAKERDRLIQLIQRFTERGESAAGSQTHPFFGKMTGNEWGAVMYKHLDHHLQQFGM